MIAVWLATAFFRGASPTLSYSTVAVPVQRALDEIGKIAGLKLEAAPAMRPEIVVVSARDVELWDLLNRIAKATSGEWHKDGDKYRLGIDNAARVKEEDAERQHRIAAYQEAIRQLTQPSKEREEDNPDGDQQQREMAQILIATDSTLPALLDRGDRLVFATNPTPMQVPFAADISETLGAFVQEQNQHTQDARRSEQDLAAQGQPVGDLGPAPVPVTLRDIAKAELVFVGGRSQGLPSAGVRLRGPLGLALDTGVSQLLPPKPAAPPSTGPADPNSPDIEYSEASRRLASVLARPAAIRTLRDELLKLWSKPSEQDPLSFSFSNQLMGVAKAHGVNLVADVPDEAGGSPVLVGRLKTASQTEAYFRRDGKLRLEYGGAWLSVRSVHPAFARKARVDRKSLEELISSARQHGQTSLDDACRFIAANSEGDPGYFGRVIRLYTLFLAPGSAMELYADPTLLRLYGSLGSGMRESLSSGTAIPIGHLSTEQMAFASKLVYSGSGLSIGDASASSVKEPNPGESDQDLEPTDLFPDGIPSNAYLSLQVEQVAAAMLKARPGFDGDYDEMTAEAQDLGQMEDMGDTDENRFSLTHYRFVPAVATHLKLRIWLTAGVCWQGELVDYSIDRDAKPVDYSDLPQPFRYAVEKAARERKANEGAGAEGVASGSP